MPMCRSHIWFVVYGHGFMSPDLLVPGFSFRPTSSGWTPPCKRGRALLSGRWCRSSSRTSGRRRWFRTSASEWRETKGACAIAAQTSVACMPVVCFSFFFPDQETGAGYYLGCSIFWVFLKTSQEVAFSPGARSRSHFEPGKGPAPVSYMIVWQI